MALKAIEYAQAKLGVVTTCANKCPTTISGPDGTPQVVFKRDSTAARPAAATKVANGKKSHVGSSSLAPTTSAGTGITIPSVALGPALRARHKRGVKRRASTDVAATEELTFLEHWRANRQPLRATNTPDGSTRLHELRLRVRSKLASRVCEGYGVASDA